MKNHSFGEWYFFKFKLECKLINLININISLTSPGEGFSIFTYSYISADAPVQGEAKGLITNKNI